MPKGNASDPFGSRGLDWEGSRTDPSGFKSSDSGGTPSDGWGPGDAFAADHLIKANRRGDRESKYSSERTVVDTPVRASVSRVRKSSAQAYEPDQWYRGPKEG